MSAARSIVLANAGSGKTWVLANRIIAWCMDDLRAGHAVEPARILAVTFTRKAAGEILARILTHAARGAEDSQKGEEARAEFKRIVGEASSAEYLCVLEAMCHQLHRMQVGTIDGLFHRIASALPEELGLASEWTIGDDSEIAHVRALAAAQVLAREDAAELVALLEDGAPKPSVLNAITSLLGGSSLSVLDIYRASALGGEESVARAWGWVQRVEYPKGVSKESFEPLVERFAALGIPTTKEGKPRKNWAGNHVKILANLRARDFRTLATNDCFARIADGEPFDRAAAPDDWSECVRLLADHLRAALLRDIAQRLDGARAVLPQADAALERVQTQLGLYSFGDIGQRVARAAVTTDSRVANAAELRAALGVDLRDLAIDEAQDTSVEQSLALRPLVEDVLGATNAAHAGRFLLVGDPKQSIYGWRGGTPGLIDDMQARYSAQLGASEPLTQSYRSAPLLMEFVNRVFANVEDDLLAHVEQADADLLVSADAFIAQEGLPQAMAVSAFKRAARQWTFTKHDAVHAKLAGRVHMYACRAKSGDDEAGEACSDALDTGECGDERTLSAAMCAARIAARIHSEFPARTVGILTRTNKEVTETIDALKDLGVQASDEGSATLLDSPAIAGLVALLRLIDSPFDRVSHFLVSHGLFAKVTGLAPLESHESLAHAVAASSSYATSMRARIADEGLGAYLSSVLVTLLRHGLGDRDRARFARAIALADDFVHEPVARLIDFIDALEAEKADSSSSDRVRVMTVHKAKGLEFNEVVLLSLDKPWGKTPTGWGMLAADPTKPPQLVAPLCSKEIRHWIPELCIFERDERRRRLLDDLSALYVAITRAREGLHLVMDCASTATGPTAARLIMKAIDRAASDDRAHERWPAMSATLVDDAPSGDTPRWSWPPFIARQEASRDERVAAVEKTHESPSPVDAGKPLVAIVARNGGIAASPSTHASRGLWTFDPFADDDIPVRGVLVHECFRDVRSVDDLATARQRERLVADARVRASIEKSCVIGDDVVADVSALLARIVASKQADNSIARSLSPAADSVVRTELPFVRELATGELLHGRIDRVELLMRDGAVVGAVLIDFKTGATACSPAQLEAKVEHYRAQLDAYALALSDMYNIERSSIRSELLFVDRGEVVLLS